MQRKAHQKVLAKKKEFVDRDIVEYEFIYDEILKMTYFFKHDCARSNKIEALLNYYEVGYTRVYLNNNTKNSNPLFLDHAEDDIKKSAISNKDDFELPALLAEITMQQEDWHFGEQRIYSYLRQQEILLYMPHIQGSIWEKQGVEFLDGELKESLSTIFSTPSVKMVLTRLDEVAKNLEFKDGKYQSN